MAHARTRNHLQHAVEKTIARAQDGGEHDLLAVDHAGFHGLQRGLDLNLVHGHLARDLVGQQGAEFVHQLAETLGAGVLAAHQRELVLDQGVIDDVDVAAHRWTFRNGGWTGHGRGGPAGQGIEFMPVARPVGRGGRTASQPSGDGGHRRHAQRRGHGIEHDALGVRVTQKTLVGRTPDGAQAHALGDFEPHLGDAAARDHHRHTHLGRLDHHLAGQATCGVEHLLAIGEAVLHGHPASDGVHRVVAPHVLDKELQVTTDEQRAGVHRTRHLVGGVAQPDGVDDVVEAGLAQQRVGRQADAVNVVHQVTEHTALAAAGGDHLVRGPVLDAVNAVAGLDRRGAHVPVHREGFDVVHRRHQPLVEQVAQHQPFGMAAQGHQRHQLALVDVDGEVALGRDRDRARDAELVGHSDLAGQGRACLGQAGQPATRGGGRLRGGRVRAFWKGHGFKF